LDLPQIGERAGVSVSAVQKAIALAGGVGLIERRKFIFPPRKVIVLTGRLWMGWLRKGTWHGPADFRVEEPAG